MTRPALFGLGPSTKSSDFKTTSCRKSWYTLYIYHIRAKIGMQRISTEESKTSPVVCKIPLLARRTRPIGQVRRATIGYLVYNLPRRQDFPTFILTHYFFPTIIFTYFKFYILKNVYCPIPVFIKFKKLNTITLIEYKNGIKEFLIAGTTYYTRGLLSGVNSPARG